ncbi:hypothetical protein C8J56DRAFT_1025225 [Mycena floridula]|nr:hypothetical protein C8J56DRAFT_1025225 [Mycena floridula]
MVLSIYLEFPVLPLSAWPRLQRPTWSTKNRDSARVFIWILRHHELYSLPCHIILLCFQPIIVLSSYGQQLVKLDSTESLHSGRIFLGALFLSALLLFLIAFHHNFGLHTSCFPYWPVFHGIDSGCRREIQALSWLNVASRVGIFLLVENSSLVNSGCHYKLIFPSICVGGETVIGWRPVSRPPTRYFDPSSPTDDADYLILQNILVEDGFSECLKPEILPELETPRITFPNPGRSLDNISKHLSILNLDSVLETLTWDADVRSLPELTDLGLMIGFTQVSTLESMLVSRLKPGERI